MSCDLVEMLRSGDERVAKDMYYGTDKDYSCV
jgi:hypothetical protein